MDANLFPCQPQSSLELLLKSARRPAAVRTAVSNDSLNLTCLVGTMIEVPRCPFTANGIAQTAEFFSFGMNDLTQTCVGIEKNPFATVDQTGVGELMKIAVEKGEAPARTSSWASAANTVAILTP